MNSLVVMVWALVGARLVLLILQVALLRQGRPAAPARHEVDPCLGPVFGLPPRPTRAADALLQDRLLRGELSKERYRAEMARLSAEDELRHPVKP